MFLGRCPTAFRRRPCLRRWPCRSAWKALRHSAFFKTMLFSAHFGVRQSKVSSRNSFRDGLLRLSLKDIHILTLGCILQQRRAKTEPGKTMQQRQPQAHKGNHITQHLQATTQPRQQPTLTSHQKHQWTCMPPHIQAESHPRQDRRPARRSRV